MSPLCPQPVSAALVSNAPVRSSLVQAGLWLELVPRGHIMPRSVLQRRQLRRRGRPSGVGSPRPHSQVHNLGPAPASSRPFPGHTHTGPSLGLQWWAGKSLLQHWVRGGWRAGWGRVFGEEALELSSPLSPAPAPSPSGPGERWRWRTRTELSLEQRQRRAKGHQVGGELGLVLASWVCSRPSDY